MTENKKTFADAFNEHVRRTARDITEIARTSGLNKDTLYAMRRGNTRNMSVDNAIKVAKAFDMTVEEFMGLSPAQIHDGLLAEIALLDPQSRSTLEAALRAQRQTQQHALTGDATTESADATPDPTSSGA